MVEAAITKATKDLRAAVKHECHMEFAELKTAIVSSRGPLAKRLAARIGARQAPRQGKISNQSVGGSTKQQGSEASSKQNKGIVHSLKGGTRAKEVSSRLDNC